jgi:hypothetical protein
MDKGVSAMGQVKSCRVGLKVLTAFAGSEGPCVRRRAGGAGKWVAMWGSLSCAQCVSCRCCWLLLLLLLFHVLTMNLRSAALAGQPLPPPEAEPVDVCTASVFCTEHV